MSFRPQTLLLLCAFAYSANAQVDSTTTDRAWFVSIQSGALLGWPNSGSPVSAHLIQGVRFNRMSMAVGVGYDRYFRWETMPVFAGLGYDFLRSKSHALFVNFNAGYSKAWTIPRENEVAVALEHEGGYFYNPLVGYRVKPGKVTLYFSVGYRVQRLTYEEMPFWGWWGRSSMKRIITHDIERVSVQMGIGFP